MTDEHLTIASIRSVFPRLRRLAANEPDGVLIAIDAADERLGAFEAAAQHVGRMANECERERLAFYAVDLLDHDADEIAATPIEKLRDLVAADDWEAYGSASGEAQECIDAGEASLDSYERVLDVLRILAAGGTPEQGAEAVGAHAE